MRPFASASTHVCSPLGLVTTPQTVHSVTPESSAGWLGAVHSLVVLHPAVTARTGRMDAAVRSVARPWPRRRPAGSGWRSTLRVRAAASRTATRARRSTTRAPARGRPGARELVGEGDVADERVMNPLGPRPVEADFVARPRDAALLAARGEQANEIGQRTVVRVPAGLAAQCSNRVPHVRLPVRAGSGQALTDHGRNERHRARYRLWRLADPAPAWARRIGRGSSTPSRPP